MAKLTFYKPNGEWGVEGVDLSTLPTKVYCALCKLHDLEHKEDAAIENLAKLSGVSASRLEHWIEWERSREESRDEKWEREASAR